LVFVLVLQCLVAWLNIKDILVACLLRMTNNFELVS